MPLLIDRAVDARLTLVTAPAAEPLTTAEAKAHLRVDHASEDAYIDTLVAAARQEIEQRTGRALITQTWDMKLEDFPADATAIEIPRAPLQSISSVSYVDAAGATQTWASSNYTVDAPAGEFAGSGLLIPNHLVNYPSTRGHFLDVTIRFVAGYGAAAAVPEGLIEAIRLLVAHWFDTRTPVALGTIATRIPEGIAAVLNPYMLGRSRVL